MKRIKVESSNLAAVGYDQQTQTLEIEFNHGGVYQYFEVPNDVYEELMSADSHGVYFSANIRNEFNFIKL